MLYSVIVVTLNAGEKLIETVRNAVRQTYEDMEILVKDGGSTDGSVEQLRREITDGRVRVITQPDKGIYDAMNQAVELAQGKFFVFMNCGDYFASSTVLDEMSHMISKDEKAIYYGDRIQRSTGQRETSPKEITKSICYRNIPCHQTCFYSADCFAVRKYNPEYRVRADYEHFLWCYFEGKVYFRYVPIAVCSYEGGGFSETKQNVKKSAREHKEIAARYFSTWERVSFRLYLILTLQPLRHAMAQSKMFSGFYAGIVKWIRR